MPNEFIRRNQWGTFQDEFGDPGSVPYAAGIGFEYTMYSTGEQTLTLVPLNGGQPRKLRAVKAGEDLACDRQVQERFGLRQLMDTFADEFGVVEVWELGDYSFAVRIFEANGAIRTLLEVQNTCSHRPF